jgi:hypothetical protein
VKFSGYVEAVVEKLLEDFQPYIITPRRDNQQAKAENS